MSGSIDFQARITSTERIMAIGEYSTAATECVKLSEQTLRQVLRDHQDRLSDAVQAKLQEAVRKRDRRKGGVDSLTMGQMVHVLRESGFLEEWARLSGAQLTTLRVLDLERLTQLRNKVMHEGVSATRGEAEFLLQSVKMVLELFGFITVETPEEERNMSENSKKPANQSGGISIGSVGGDAQVTQVEGGVTGNVAGRDMILQESSTSATISYGFKQENDKTEFLQQIEELRSALRQMKGEIEASETLDEEQKDELALDVMQQVKNLKTVKAEAEATPPGKEAPKAKAKLVESYLDKTTTLMEKLKNMSEATGAASKLVLPALVNAWPLLLKVRKLFGLP